MSLPPVPNTRIESNNIWLSWFNRIRVLVNQLVRVFTIDTNNNVTTAANFTIPGSFSITNLTVNSLTARLATGQDPNFQLSVYNGTGNAQGDLVARLVMRYFGVAQNTAGLFFIRGDTTTDTEVGLVANNAVRATARRNGTFRLTPLASPTNLVDGDMWYDPAAGRFRGRAAGVTVDFH